MFPLVICSELVWLQTVFRLSLQQAIISLASSSVLFAVYWPAVWSGKGPMVLKALRKRRFTLTNIKQPARPVNREQENGTHRGRCDITQSNELNTAWSSFLTLISYFQYRKTTNETLLYLWFLFFLLDVLLYLNDFTPLFVHCGLWPWGLYRGEQLHIMALVLCSNR